MAGLEGRVVEKMVPEVMTREEVRGWWEDGKRGVSRSIPSTVEAIDRSIGLSGVLLNRIALSSSPVIIFLI